MSYPSRAEWLVNMITFGYINISLFILLWVKASVVWGRETDGWRQRQILYWSITSCSHDHTMQLSTMPYLVLLALVRVGLLNRRLAVCRFLSGVLSVQASTDSKLTLTLTTKNPSTWVYAYIISSSPRFQISHLTASAYLHWCVLFREISDGSVKDQYAKDMKKLLFYTNTWCYINAIICVRNSNL